MIGEVMKNAPVPGTPEHTRMVTASKIPAMVRDAETGEYLGVGYTSAFDLWHVMAGEVEEHIDADTQAMFDDAHDAEDYAVNVWKRANPGWRTGSGEVAYTDPELPFPNVATIDRRASRGSKRRIIEVKRPRKDSGPRDGWTAQIVFQMGLSGIHEADLVVVPVYGKPAIYPVQWSPDLFAAICRDALAFWELLQAGDPPPATGDSKLASQIYAEKWGDPDGETELDGELVEAWIAASKKVRAADEQAAAIEHRIREAMGDHQKATFDGRTVVSRTAGRFAAKRIPADLRDQLENYTTEKFDAARLKRENPQLHALGMGAPGHTFNRKAFTDE